MGSIIPPRATISGTVAAPGITLFDVPTSGLYETASYGVGISLVGANYFTLDSTHFTVGPAPAGTYTLSAIAGSPLTISGTVLGFKVSPNGQFAVFGLNAAAPGIETYKINADGTMTFVASYNTTNAINGVEFSPDGKFVYGFHVLGIDQFSINPSTGALTSLGLAAAVTQVQDIDFSSDGLFAYAIDNSGFGGAHTFIHVYSRNIVTGTINTPALASYDIGPQSAAGRIAVTSVGVQAIVTNVATLYPFLRNASTGLLTALTTINANAVALYVESSPDGSFVYFALNNNTILGYSVNATTGVLTPLTGSPYAAAMGAGGASLVITNDGTFMYASGTTVTNLLPFTRDVTTGIITATAAFNTGVASAAIDVVADNYIYSYGATGLVAVKTAAAITHPLIECTLDPAGLGGTFTINGALYVGGVPLTLPTLSGNAGKFLRVNTGATGYVWDGVNNNVAVAMVANAGAFTVEDSGNYQVELTGALTAQGALTATLSVPSAATQVLFDNKTTGGFPSLLNNTWTVPLGKSTWYWNGATFEQITGTSPVVLYKSGVPSGIAPSGTVAANGALTLGTALPTTYSGGLWLYFPAGALFAGSAAGSYWTVMSSTTLGTVYNNTLTTPGPLTPPAAPTAIVAAGPGAYVGTLATVTLAGFTIPANMLGKNGCVLIKKICKQNATANNKSYSTLFGGTPVTSAVLTTTSGANFDELVFNQNDVAKQASTSNSVGLGTLVAAALYSTINTAAPVIVSISASLSVSTDFVVNEGIFIDLVSDGL